MKTCFKCDTEKPLSEFYKHRHMADGHLNKCKACTKKDVLNNRWANIERIREYDRNRGSRQSPEYAKEYRERYPNKYKAHYMISNAKRVGKVVAMPCEICGTDKRVHAHHDDYLKPLEIRWLCSAHHKQWHRDNGEGLNP